MSWARLDDGATEHLKVRRAGTAGMALWTAGIVWSSRHLTDGHIPRDMLADLWRPVGETFDAEAAAERLVELGMWVDVGDGWEIHDYLDYNMPADEVRRRRELATERQRRWRTRNLNGSVESEPVTRDETGHVTRDETGDSRASHATPYPYPSRPVPDPYPSPTTTHTPRGRARPGSTIIDCPDPLGEHDSVTSAELPWRAWLLVSRDRGMTPTNADRRKEATHLEQMEARIVEAAHLMATARGVDPGVAAKMLTVTAMKRFGKLYDAEREPGEKRKPALAWRLGWVASRWTELTAGAIPAEAAE